MLTPLRLTLRTFGHLYPFYSGSHQLADTALFRSLAPHQPVQTRLKNGKKLIVNPQDYIGRMVYYFQDHQPKVTFFCRKLLDRGDTFIDIGANIGVVSLNCIHAVGALGTIHAFEPQPNLVEHLHSTVDANQLQNVVIHPFALSDADGVATLHIDPENIGYAAISGNFSGLPVPIETKDSASVLAEILRNPAPYLIKMDVEGHELVILDRAKRILTERTPKAIIFEFVEDDSKQAGSANVFSVLKEMDMPIYLMRSRSMLQPALQRLPDDFTPPPSADYVAVPSNRVDWLKQKVRVFD